MKKKIKEKPYFYSSLNIQENSQIWNKIKPITQLGYTNIIIKFDEFDLLKSWIEDGALDYINTVDNEKINLTYRIHLSHNANTSEPKKIRRVLSRVIKLEEKYNIVLIKSIDEALSDTITPNHMEYYGVKLITLSNFRWKILKRFHKHKVYFEMVLDRLFREMRYMANALPILEPLEKTGKLLFTQVKPVIKVTEFPYILSTLTDGKYASYGPITRWSEIIW